MFLSYLKENDIISKNKSIENKSRKVKKNNKQEYNDLQLKKISDNYNSKIKNNSKSELSNKEKINKKRRKDEQSINLDFLKINEKKKTLGERNDNDLKINNNDYSSIMRKKKRK